MLWNWILHISKICLYLSPNNECFTYCYWFSLKGQTYFWSISAGLSKVSFHNYRDYYQAVKWIIYMASLHCLLTSSENDTRAFSERRIWWYIILRRLITLLLPRMDVYLTRIMNGGRKQVLLWKNLVCAIWLEVWVGCKGSQFKEFLGWLMDAQLWKVQELPSIWVSSFPSSQLCKAIILV